MPHVTQAAATDRKSKADSTPDVIPIFCVLLGLVILGTIIWAVVKARRQRTQAKMTQSSTVAEGQAALPLVTEEQTRSQRTCNNVISIPPDSAAAAGVLAAGKSCDELQGAGKMLCCSPPLLCNHNSSQVILSPHSVNEHNGKNLHKFALNGNNRNCVLRQIII